MNKITFYECLQKKKMLNTTQKESMADIFCFRGHHKLRARFIISIDILTQKGTKHDLQQYYEPFNQIVFSDNECVYTPLQDIEKASLNILLESIRIMITNQAERPKKRSYLR